MIKLNRLDEEFDAPPDFIVVPASWEIHTDIEIGDDGELIRSAIIATVYSEDHAEIIAALLNRSN